MDQNNQLKEQIDFLKRQNEDLHYLCRKNQLLNKDFDDFESTLQLKGMSVQTADAKRDVPFFPGRPIWQRMKRKTGVSAKIKRVFAKEKIQHEAGMVASKSARNLGIRGRGELKEFTSNRENQPVDLERIKNDIIEKRNFPGVKSELEKTYGELDGKNRNNQNRHFTN